MAMGIWVMVVLFFYVLFFSSYTQAGFFGIQKFLSFDGLRLRLTTPVIAATRDPALLGH